MSSLLPDALSEFRVAMDAAVDEVVCVVPAGQLAEVCEHLKREPRLAFDYLRLLTVVDYVERDGEFEVVYHLYSLRQRHKMMLKTRVPESRPVVPSVTGVWRGANWYEREMHDLFGVEFTGHPDLSPLVLPEDFDGFPGRKSYPLNDYDEW